MPQTPRRTAAGRGAWLHRLPRIRTERAQPVVLTALLVWALFDRTRRGWSPMADVCLALLILAGFAWMGMSRRPGLRILALAVLAGCGGELAMVTAPGPGTAVGALALVIAASGWRPEFSLAVLAFAVLGAATAAVATDTPATTWLKCVVTFAAFWAIGIGRRSYRLRAEQAERALAQERRAVAAEKHAAALEERTRIAREIHDILAHSLSALAVNLNAAEGFLAGDGLPAERRELVKAQECVRRAGRLAREGMVETRRAVLALRENPRPLTESLAELAAEAEIPLEVTGSPAPLPAAVGLTVFRTAQEALTNARKHAPDAAVAIRLDYGAGAVALTVRNALPPEGASRPLAESGAGHGLTGLAERAAVVGGTLDAGDDGDGHWRVRVRVPR